MASTGTAIVTLQRPVTMVTGSAHDEREQRHEDARPLCVWMMPVRAERAVHALGVLTDRAAKVRFRAPSGMTERIAAGWRLKDDEGRIWEVKTAIEMRGLWDLVVERV